MGSCSQHHHPPRPCRRRCVKLLLDKGYTVHTTTRTAGKADFLNRIPGAAERLKIFAGCDLLSAGSFDAAIRGCDAVLHTASPFYSKGGSVDKVRLCKDDRST